MANLYQFPTSTWAGTAGYTVCVAVTGSSPALLLERAESLLAGQSFLELRLDSLPDPTRRRAASDSGRVGVAREQGTPVSNSNKQL